MSAECQFYQPKCSQETGPVITPVDGFSADVNLIQHN